MYVDIELKECRDKCRVHARNPDKIRDGSVAVAVTVALSIDPSILMT